MIAQKKDNPVSINCKVECQENHYSIVGTFQCRLHSSFDGLELDQIEAEVERIGQEFKRQLCEVSSFEFRVRRAKLDM